MNDIYVAARPGLPEIDFRFSQERFALRGPSCPTSATAFYGPLGAALMAYLAKARGRRIRIEVSPVYFNGSSQRVLRGLFGMLDAAWINDNEVCVDWHYDPVEAGSRDLGLDLADEFIMLRYRMIPRSATGAVPE